MGLLVGIYRNTYNSKNNIFGGYDEVVVTNVEGPFQPRPYVPAARLAQNLLGNPIVVPDMEWFHENNMFEDVTSDRMMNGGAYAATSDSRFGDAVRALNANGYCAIPVHDYSIQLEGSM
jgi:hypothetical protein